MKVSGIGRGAALLLSSLLLAAAVEAKDVYKASLDPGIPRHRAVLDTLQRLEANPKDAGLKNDLGCLIAQEGFWRDALREFSEAAALDPKDSRPNFNAGLVKAARGEWYGARGEFASATKRDPGNWAAWWMKGFAEEQLGNSAAAIEAYRVSLRVDTSLFDVSVNPWAAWTRLKGRVFLEAYESRRVRATMPGREQYSDPERVASFFQKRRGPAPTPGSTPVAQAEPSQGPVVASVPPPASAAAAAAAARPQEGPMWNPRARPASRDPNAAGSRPGGVVLQPGAPGAPEGASAQGAQPPPGIPDVGAELTAPAPTAVPVAPAPGTAPPSSAPGLVHVAPPPTPPVPPK